MRAMVDGDRQIVRRQSTDRIDGHTRGFYARREAIPAERGRARMRGGRLHRSNNSKIDLELRRMRNEQRTQPASTPIPSYRRSIRTTLG